MKGVSHVVAWEFLHPPAVLPGLEGGLDFMIAGRSSYFIHGKSFLFFIGTLKLLLDYERYSVNFSSKQLSLL